MKRPLDIAVISDVHLGTYGCHAKELLNYLGSIEPKILVINGDFMDIWNFRKSYFPKEHINVLRYILKMADKGTEIYYITGNHDDALRRFSPFESGQIHLRDKLILQLNGKRYWFFHGDIFDTLIQYSPMIAKLGGKGYDFLILFNRFINEIRAYFGKGRMSFTKKVKDSVKKATKFISDFENTAINLAAREGYDYVICGHIHKPQITYEKRENKFICYMNSGDWVENLTSLEYTIGIWKIHTYDENDYAKVSPRLHVKEEEESDLEAKSTAALFADIIGQRP
ncbi:MAG: UDP-2,3-diacylglucosamine pyrophosphatase LpxH [Saprospiraceae bacterium]|jgi:UDP-2,3-diacylglucosamine pyrophosphatase LpxH